MDLAPHHDMLRTLTRIDPDPHVRHRADRLLLVAGGFSSTKAATLIGCSRNSLRTCGQRSLAEGRVGVIDRRRQGRPPKLGTAARELLDTALAASPLAHDYPVTIWTEADLTDVLRRRGWPVSTATVNRTLHAMGDVHRRPRRDLRHRQDAEAVACAKHVLAELQKRGLVPGLASDVSTLDACDRHTHPHLAHVWQRRGRPVMASAVGKDQRRAVFGALDDGWGHVIRQLQSKKGGVAFADVLAQIAQTLPDEHLILVMDTVSDHRFPMVRAWWAAQDGRVTSFWLPVSTPNLNLRERLWRDLNQKLACHRFWADGEGLGAAAATLLDRMEAHVHPDTGPAICLRNDFCEAA